MHLNDNVGPMTCGMREATFAEKSIRGNNMFVSGSKTPVIKFRDKMVAPNETTDLYGTSMILTKST